MMQARGEGDFTPSSIRGSGVRQHLLRKAQDCNDARKLYTDRIADAQGNDVFKYVLLLNCIECQGYVAETQLQAHQSFRWTTRAAVSGFGLVGTTFLAMISLPMLLRDFKVEITTISVISGVMTTFISSIFFYLYRESLRRMDKFHDQLREIQKIVFGLFLMGISGEKPHNDDERREILRVLLHHDEAAGNGSERNNKPELAAQ